jgi:hypothetical protein
MAHPPFGKNLSQQIFFWNWPSLNFYFFCKLSFLYLLQWIIHFFKKNCNNSMIYIHFFFLKVIPFYLQFYKKNPFLTCAYGLQLLYFYVKIYNAWFVHFQDQFPCCHLPNKSPNIKTFFHEVSRIFFEHATFLRFMFSLILHFRFYHFCLL